MDKPFNHLIICLTFVMPVAALTGCAGSNGTDEESVIRISSCVARGEDGQEMSVSEFGMFVTDASDNLYADNIPASNRSGKWTFTDISLSDGEKGIYAYYPYNTSESGGKISLDARNQTDYLYSEKTAVSPAAPSVSIVLYHLLSKVTFKMPASGPVQVKVTDYAYPASYNLLTGTLEVGQAKGTVSSPAGSLLLYPGNNPAMPVSLLADGRSYDFVIPAATFRSGKEYVYTLRPAGNGVEIEDITISGWQPGGDYEGTITEKERI